MAHLLDSTRDIAYVGKTPWHGLGTPLQPDADLDQWRLAANLAWTAEKRQAYFSTRCPQTGKNIPTPVEDRWALVRSDTQLPLGVVSTRYQPVQPAEVIDFYRDLTEEQGFSLETAGCLAGGKRIWALAKTGAETRIKGQDKLQSYLLLATSYDGTMATTARFTSVRVVCQNTLSFSLSEGGAGAGAGSGNTISIPHNAKFVGSRVKAQLGLCAEAWSAFEERVAHLADVKVDETLVLEYLKQVLGEESTLKVNARGQAQLSTNAKKIVGLFHRGRGQDLASARGTAWGLVNAVTEYYDHHSKTRGGRSLAGRDSRLDSAWFGRGAAIKAKAWNVACELADVA